MRAQVSYLKPVDIASATPSLGIALPGGQDNALSDQFQSLLAAADPVAETPVLVEDTGAANFALGRCGAAAYFKTSSPAVAGDVVEADRAPAISSISLTALPAIFGGAAKRMRFTVVAIDADSHGDTCVAASAIAFERSINAAFAAGAERICLLQGGLSDGATRMIADVLGAQGDSREGKVRSLQPGDVARLIVEDAVDFDVVIADAQSAEMLSGFAVAATRTERYAVRSAYAGEGSVFAPLQGVAAGTDDDTSLPVEAVMLSGVAALVSSHRYTAATTLHNALLRTLEDGLHSAAIRHVGPYTRILEDHALIAAIGERLGEAPRRIEPVAYASRARGAAAANSKPALRLVHSAP
ncbi:MAG: hypothetical protein ACX939_03670 [Hyphococcus sp.]